MSELNVRELRAKRGLSQAAFARQIGIPKYKINNWEQDKGAPKGEDYVKLKKLAENEVEILQADLKSVISGNSDYVLIPKSVIQDKYRLIAVEQLEKDKAQIEKDKAQIEKERVQLEIEKQRIINDGVKDKVYTDLLSSVTHQFAMSIDSLVNKGNSKTVSQ